MMAQYCTTKREAERMVDLRECPECNVFVLNEDVTYTYDDQRLACNECRAPKPPRALLANPDA